MAAMSRQYSVPGDLSTSWDGPATPVNGSRLSLGLEWTGTPTGTFSIQCSFTGNTWRTVPGSAAAFTSDGNAQPAGGASGIVVNVANMPGSLWRLSYARTSGTGTVVAHWRQE